jgi:hypothetical protein
MNNKEKISTFINNTTQTLPHPLNNREKLEYIRSLNRRLGLPQQEPDDTLFNGQFFSIPTLDHEGMIVPLYPFTHPLPAYPQDDEFKFIREYGILIGEANKPKTVSVGALDPKPNRFFINLITREANNASYWVLVQHKVFLFQEFPFYTTDFISPLTLLSEPGQKYPPSDTDFRPGVVDLDKLDRIPLIEYRRP